MAEGPGVSVIAPERKKLFRRGGAARRRKIKIKPIHLMRFARHLSIFLGAGVPILDALAIIRSDTPDATLGQVIGDISDSLRTGADFSSAVAATSAFPPVFVSMLRSAEASGRLDVVLGQLAHYVERDLEARTKIRGSLTYPAIVVCLAFASVAILVGFVLPRFETFFDSFDARLPLPTRILVSLTHFLTATGPALAGGGVVMVGALVGTRRTGWGRALWDRALLRAPIIGKLIRFGVIERFSRILSAMVQAGVPLPDALQLAKTGMSNRSYEPKLAAARHAMIEGEGLYGPLARTGLFPAAAIQMIRVGEETGTLDDRLEDVARFYETELEHKLKNFTNLLEPVAIVTVGLVVGFVAIALVSAIYGVFQQVR